MMKCYYYSLFSSTTILKLLLCLQITPHLYNCFNQYQYHYQHYSHVNHVKTSTALSSSSTTTTTSTNTNVDVEDNTGENIFISELQKSLKDDSFLSYTLWGPKAKTKSDKQILRGNIKLVEGRLIYLNKNNKKKKKKNNKTKKKEEVEIEVEQEVKLQTNIKFHGATDVAKNWAIQNKDKKDENNEENDEVKKGLNNLLSGNFMKEISNENSDIGNVDYFDTSTTSIKNEGGIQRGELCTENGKWILEKMKNKKQNNNSIQSSSSLFSMYSCRFVKSNINNNNNNNNIAKEKIVFSHDRRKNVPLEPDALFLQKLGISDSHGKPKIGMKSKLKQCQRFVEIVGKLVEKQYIIKNDSIIDKKKNSRRPLNIIDMGCGRAYLTFSLHSYLSNNTLLKSQSNIQKVQSCGIDIRPKLVREINGIAKDLGEPFDSLKFVSGAIEDFVSSPNQKEQKEQNNNKQSGESTLDILIALHACDTATDDAIWFGLERKAKMIVVAPCCHKEVRKQLDSYYLSKSQTKTQHHDHHPLDDVLRHGIYRERISESITDSIRALLLEIAGYNIQVFEFIGGEHTSKNVMITAVLNNENVNDNKNNNKDEEMVSQSQQHDDTKIDRLKYLASSHGIKEHKLANWMGISLE